MFSHAVRWFKSFLGRDDGVTAIEYGLLAGLVAVATVGALIANGDALEDTFTPIQSALYSGNSTGLEGDAGTGSGGDQTASNDGGGGDTPDDDTNNSNTDPNPPSDPYNDDSSTSLTPLPD